MKTLLPQRNWKKVPDPFIVGIAFIVVIGTNIAQANEIIYINDNLQYEITSAFDEIGVVHGINDNGAIVGSYLSERQEIRPYYWDSADGFIDIGNDFETSDQQDWGEAYGVNRNGEVVGFYDSHQFLWSKTAGVINESLPLYPGAINNHGVIAGMKDGQLATWDSTNGLDLLGNLGGDIYPIADINDNGRIVGASYISIREMYHHAFIWDEISGMQDLGGISLTFENTTSIALAINSTDNIVGKSWHYGVRWNEAKEIFDMGIELGEPTDINDIGQIVGTLPGGYGDAFLIDQESGLLILEDYFPKNSLWSYLGGEIHINNAGQIVGTGTYNDQPCVFMMTPVPEPGMSVLLLLGSGLAWRRRGKGMATKKHKWVNGER
ncbi:MAG: PEP-CTERM sorting domain-containing protein [Sedimentisphaerales bacterium]|nr:PEP-CTERM sorting domain-containing protein [Sedimentisphaerales bacterium]